MIILMLMLHGFVSKLYALNLMKMFYSRHQRRSYEGVSRTFSGLFSPSICFSGGRTPPRPLRVVPPHPPRYSEWLLLPRTRTGSPAAHSRQSDIPRRRQRYGEHRRERERGYDWERHPCGEFARCRYAWRTSCFRLWYLWRRYWDSWGELKHCFKVD